MKKKIKKLSKKDLQVQTKIQMLESRIEDSENLRKKVLDFLKNAEIDLDIIKKTKEKLKNQLIILEHKEVKTNGAILVLQMVLESK